MCYQAKADFHEERDAVVDLIERVKATVEPALAAKKEQNVKQATVKAALQLRITENMRVEPGSDKYYIELVDRRCLELGV